MIAVHQMVLLKMIIQHELIYGMMSRVAWPLTFIYQNDSSSLLKRYLSSTQMLMSVQQCVIKILNKQYSTQYYIHRREFAPSPTLWQQNRLSIGIILFLWGTYVPSLMPVKLNLTEITCSFTCNANCCCQHFLLTFFKNCHARIAVWLIIELWINVWIHR